MIELDGKKLNPRHNGAEVEKLMYNAWKKLDEKYKLSEGGSIKFILKKEFMQKSIVSNEKGTSNYPMLRYPAGINIAAREEIYIDYEPKEVRYFKTKGGKEGAHTYSPTGILIKAQISLTAMDKDLILFLYVFSRFVETKPDHTVFTKNTAKLVNKFYFEDAVAQAKEKMTLRKKAAYAYTQLETLTEADVRRFADTINIPEAKFGDKEVISERIMTMVENNISIKNSKMYDLLVEFVGNHDSRIYVVEDLVREGLKRKMVTWERAKNHQKHDIITWFYAEGGVKKEEIYSFVGSTTKSDNLVNYLLANSDALDTFTMKIGDVKK